MTNMEKNEKKCINTDNPNNHAFWQTQGFENRPKNWKELLKTLPKSKRAKKKEINDRYDISFPLGIHYPLCADDY